MSDDEDERDQLAGEDEPRDSAPAWPSIIRSSNTGRAAPTAAINRVRGNQPRPHRFHERQ